MQAMILDAIRDNDRVAVRSCHGAGKSWIAACAVLWFLFTHRDSIVITTAPTGRQVKKILWAEIHQAYDNAPIALGGRLLGAELAIDPKWFAFGFSTDVGDSFQGPHAEHMMAVLDEASGVAPEIWTAVEGVLSSEHARLLTIGNPTDPTSPFAGECKSGTTKTFHISAFDTPNFTAFGITLEDIRAGTWQAKITGPMPFPPLTTPAWVADKWKRWGDESPLWLARVMAQFPEHSTDTLIPLAWVEAAQQRDLPAGDPNELGLDVARFGSDRTVFAHRRGPRVRIVETHAKEDTMQTTGRAVQALRNTSATAVKVDDIGVGGGVTDRGREQKLPFVPINVGEAATDPEKYANLRAELAWSLRERFQDGTIDIDPEDDELAEELTTIKYKFRSGGQIQVESKDDVKKRLKRSPDRMDAVVLAFAPTPRQRRLFAV